MGNCCCSFCCCCPGSSSSSSSPRGKFQLLDDDWADEIWYDAVERHDDDDYDDEGGTRSINGQGGEDTALLSQHHETVYQVTDEELEILRTTLTQQFPRDAPTVMSDAYLRSVASKPYSKDMTRRRPLEYSLEKLTHVLQWRQEMSAVEMPLRIQWCRDYATRPDSVPSADVWKRAQKMVESLNTGSMYWHGLTKEGRPILWIRTSRKFWYPNVAAEVDALMAMADAGITHGMGPDITDFVCISYSHNPPPPNPPFAYQMLRGLVKGYPDRMHRLVSAPVSSIVEFCMNLLLPLMPGRLAHKFSFYSLEHVQEKLTEMLWHGEDDIPTFFGGPVDHDAWYPPVEECPRRGPGSLKFDWYGMIERLQEQRDLFQQQQQQQEQQQQS